MPYPLPEVIVNGVTTGHNTHALDLNKDWNKRYESVFYTGPPASGSATGKDKAAVLAAIDAAKALTRGGTVQFGAGDYNVGDLAILCPEFNVTGKQLTLKGAGGERATRLWFSTDRAAGTYAVDEDGLASASGGFYKTVIEDIAFIGPTATRGTLGTAPCNLSGIRLSTHTGVYRCSVNFFKHGIESNGNHSVVRDCAINNNYHGIYFTAVAGAGGDVLLDNVSRAGNLMGSDAVSPTGVAAYHSVKGHLGFGPYAVYLESRTAGNLAMTGCVYDGTSWEFMGNGMIYSVGQTAFCTDMIWRNCANFSITTDTTYKMAPAFTTHIYLHSFTAFEFVGSDSPGDGATFIDVIGTLGYGKVSPALGQIANSILYSAPWIKGPAGASQAMIELSEVGFSGVAVPVDTATAVTAKQLVEWTQFGWVRAKGTTGAGAFHTMTAGVALTSATANARDFVCVAQESQDVEVNMTGGVAPNNNQVLIPSAATPSSVVPASWDGTTANATRPVLGQLYLAVAGNATVRMRLKVQ